MYNVNGIRFARMSTESKTTAVLPNDVQQMLYNFIHKERYDIGSHIKPFGTCIDIVASNWLEQNMTYHLSSLCSGTRLTAIRINGPFGNAITTGALNIATINEYGELEDQEVIFQDFRTQCGWNGTTQSRIVLQK